MKAQKPEKPPKVEILPSGRARIRGTIYYANGKRVESFTEDTPARALAAFYTAQNLSASIHLPENKPAFTLGDAIDKYIEKRRVGCSPSTIRGYSTIRRNAFKSIMGNDIFSLTQEQLQEAADQETLNGLSPKTVKNRVDLLREVFKENKLTLDVTIPDARKSKDDSEGDIRFLDDKQLQLFLTEIYGGKYEIPCYLALNSLRLSEILAVDWDKVNLTTGKITVLGAVVPNEEHKLVKKKSNKNRTSKRTIPILYPRLTELLEEADKSKPVVSFVPQRLYEWINVRCRKLDIPEIGIHGLRHTGASYCMWNNVKPRTIMEWFGWSVPDTMNKIYIHMSEGQKDEEAEKVISAANAMRGNVAKSVAKNVAKPWQNP